MHVKATASEAAETPDLSPITPKSAKQLVLVKGGTLQTRRFAFLEQVLESFNFYSRELSKKNRNGPGGLAKTGTLKEIGADSNLQ